MNEAGGGEPKIPFEVPKLPEQPGKAEERAIETGPAEGESAAGKQPTPAVIQPLPVIPDVPVAMPAATGQPTTLTPVTSTASSKLTAHDTNLIEKQWVDKAKEIVAQTKSDPHKQKAEMSKVKADYIQKRFNKPIKTDDAVTV
ncbi:hypothetical protein HYW36_02750 [Candidatus Saccharibacteria bacterium]|nr:hypothetical protein [Candidatus Saccharibacteria bacterium]